MSEDEKENLIPRNYQVALMEIALKQNTIIYLPTGSGKTFIAIMVLKRMSESLSRSYSQGGKISFILVNTVALVDQHAKYVKDHTILNVGCYSGEMNLDFWKQEQWRDQFNKFNVLVMTSQILVNIISCHFINLSQVNLIIFDECHRGVEDQPMRQIMKYFQAFDDQPHLEPPRILGLTATLLNGNCKLDKVMEQVKILETTFQSKVATVDGLEDVVGFSTNPKEKFKICAMPELAASDEQAIHILNEVLRALGSVRIDGKSDKRDILLADSLKPLEATDVLRKLKNFISDLIYHIEILGTFGAYKACVAFMIQVERVKKHAEDISVFCILNYVLTKMALTKELLKTAMDGYSDHDRIYKFSSDKMLRLFEVLKDYKTLSKEELCGLIFVKRRFTAKVIFHILISLAQADSEFNHVKPNFITGNNNNPYNDSRESLYISKKNKEVIDSFANKEINVLVSSNVLEEGVDIPKCTLVIKFDKAEEYRSYIQSKGRARHRTSLYYTLIEQDDVGKFKNKYLTFQKIENLLNDFLVGKNDSRESPSRMDICNMYNENEIQPYFVDGPNSAQVNMVTAITRLCQYCSSVPGDQYTVHAPEWYLEQENNLSCKVRVVILLPLSCPIIEPIVGPFMYNKKNAKRAAALYACIALHKCGELDDHLLPSKKEISEEDVSYLFSHWPDDKEKVAGFKKRKRLHEIKVANCIKDAVRPDEKVYLHVITFEPGYKRSEDFNLATVYDMLTNTLRFGIISSKPLPDNLFQFPMFDSMGSINVEIKTNMKTLKLTNQQLLKIREFHFLIFSDLLEVLKDFLVFDNKGDSSENLLVVPVQDNDHIEIDFTVLTENTKIKSKQEPTDRINLKVTEEAYLHKIVSPWYRTESSPYLVTRVCEEKTPRSRFPNDDFSDFAEYYRQKHTLGVLNPDQPLLLVKGLSRSLNTFKPKGFQAKRKRDKRFEELEEYLLPEFVIKQEFPACLWVQARFLPCVLSRLTYMLKLEQLQQEIAREIGADVRFLRNCPKLQLDTNLLTYEPYESNVKELLDVPASTSSDLLQLESSLLLTKSYNKDFATKMLEAEYPWRNIEEPKDIERALDVNVLDIEQYEQFIGQHATKRLNKNLSPARQNVPAITYPKDFEERPLKILSVEYNGQIPNLCQFYKSLTAAEANDIVNLERLETLGDSFLKFIASLYITSKFTTYNEGKCTMLKGRLVSNKNLYYLGKKKELAGILKNKAFCPTEDWVPPAFCAPEYIVQQINLDKASINSLFWCKVPQEQQISGVLDKNTIANAELQPIADDEENSYPSMCNFIKRQYVSDKTMADSVEAMLGAHFQTGGMMGAIKFVEWIGIIPRSENLKDIFDQPAPNPIVDGKATNHNLNLHIPQWANFEKRLGYSFKNRGFLLQALTHGSYSCNRITYSYERLEFIGDAILDFLITCYIYEYCDNLNPGQVTDLRSALVNNNTFASLVVRCGFHKFLLMINVQLQGHIDKFAEYLASKDYVIDDEVLILLEEKDLNLAEYVDVPKVLGDIFEAIAGAVYLDSGKNLQTVWKVFHKIMWKEIELFSIDVPKNVIRRLFEYHTAYPVFSKEKSLDNNMVMVALEFMCEGRKKRVHGFGTNKIMARRAASKIALRSLKM